MTRGKGADLVRDAHDLGGVLRRGADRGDRSHADELDVQTDLLVILTVRKTGRSRITAGDDRNTGLICRPDRPNVMVVGSLVLLDHDVCPTFRGALDGEVPVARQRGTDRNVVLYDRLEAFLIHEHRMLDCSCARRSSLHDAVPGFGVTEDGPVLVRRLGDHSRELFEGHGVAVSWAVGICAGPAGLHLDPVGPVLDLLTHNIARLPRAGDDRAEARLVVLLSKDVRRMPVNQSAPDRDDLLRRLHARAWHDPRHGSHRA